MTSHLDILAIEAGPVATYCYMLTDEKHGIAVVVDLPMGVAETCLEEAKKRNLVISAILLTHSHWDHVADVAPLHAATQAPIYLHKADEYRLLDPMPHTLWKEMGWNVPFVIEPAKPDVYLHHGDILRFGDWEFEVRHTPGHTEGGVCFLAKNENIALVGDTLFAGSIGRTDLPGGNTEELLASIQRELLTLDDAMHILPGHGEPSTIGVERESNPYL